jgi:hypothetical protein
MAGAIRWTSVLKDNALLPAFTMAVPPTALQPGDIVLEIDGRPIAEIVGDALTLQPTPPADWRPATAWPPIW